MTALQNKPSGWLVVDKPLGISSAAVVGKVKRMLPKGTKIGHAGTLDPLATGVLPLAIGEATKLCQYMIDSDKAYDFEVTWGQERSTDDGEGEVVASADVRFKIDDLRFVMQSFIGEIEQVPPQYSAIKVDGQRSYKAARQGVELELKARKVIVQQLNLTSEIINHKSTFHMQCSKGTYVRSIARDMGRKLGCYGYVSGLRRCKHGSFDISAAKTLEQLEELCKKGALAEAMLPPQEVLDGIPALQLSLEEEKKIRNGIALNRQTQISGLVALFSASALVAMASSHDGCLKPVRVFNL